jgi:hypothetical protein
MPITTVTVSIAVHQIPGVAMSSGSAWFELTAADIDSAGVVAPKGTSVPLDDN